jgi:hypothetical protein
MTYPKSPTSDSSCVEYAKEIGRIRKKTLTPMRRKSMIRSIHAINYIAVEEDEVVDYLEEFEII